MVSDKEKKKERARKREAGRAIRGMREGDLGAGERGRDEKETEKRGIERKDKMKKKRTLQFSLRQSRHERNEAKKRVNKE